MFFSRDLCCVLRSRDLDVLRAQRITGLFILITHKSTRSEYPITWFALPIGKPTNAFLREGEASF